VEGLRRFQKKKRVEQRRLMFADTGADIGHGCPAGKATRAPGKKIRR